MDLDVRLISEPEKAVPLLLSIGYGNAHIVIEIDDRSAVEEIAAFMEDHRDMPGAHWMEIGRFGPLPVTLTVMTDKIAIVVDSDVAVGAFGQSTGLYLPRTLLDGIVAVMKNAIRPDSA